jgi:hypothetical protein
MKKKKKINLTKELEDLDFSNYEILSKMEPNYLAAWLVDLLELHKLPPTKKNIYTVATILESDLMHQLLQIGYDDNKDSSKT